MNRYIRDMHGYGKTPPDPQWVGGAKIAVQFVLNYEEGGENCILHGDQGSEAFLSEIVDAEPWPGKRHWNMESIYEYGARAGFWRLHRLFTTHNIPVTVFGIATALARSPAQVDAMNEAGWEIASHGYKWIEHKDFSKQEELKHIENAIRLHEEVTGSPPLGWYTGRCSENTLDLIADIGSFEYGSDSYADDLPYWYTAAKPPLLVVPYTLDINDMRFATSQGFNSGDQFYSYLKDSFDTLYMEGTEGQAKMMSIGLHCRLAGRPGRFAALKRFIDYVQSFEKVWFATRLDIARHWQSVHPYEAPLLSPSTLPKAEFINLFGSIFTNASWVAENAYDLELGPSHDCVEGTFNALRRAFLAAGKEVQLKVFSDFANEIATSKEQNTNTNHQELNQYKDLCRRYEETFGFSYISDVQGSSISKLLNDISQRLSHDFDIEFAFARDVLFRQALKNVQSVYSGVSTRD